MQRESSRIVRVSSSRGWAVRVGKNYFLIPEEYRHLPIITPLVRQHLHKRFKYSMNTEFQRVCLYCSGFKRQHETKAAQNALALRILTNLSQISLC